MLSPPPREPAGHDPTAGRLAESVRQPEAHQVAGRSAFVGMFWLAAVAGLVAHASEGLDLEVVLAAAILVAMGTWLHAVHRIHQWVIGTASSQRLAFALAGVNLGLAALIATDPAHLILLFGVYTLTFGFAVRRGEVIAWSGLTTGIWTAGWWLHGLPLGALGTPVLVWGTLNMIASVMDRVSTQNAERGALLSEIERTRARLVAAERSRGVLEERTRVSAEIHDTLAQGFTSIVLLAEATAARLSSEGDVELAASSLDLIETTARENLDSARRLVEALRPAALDGDNLPDALRALAARHEELSGVHVAADLADPGPLGGALDVAILSVVREALANSAKHARATAVAMRLEVSGDEVVVDIADDGVGFEPGSSPTEVAGGVGGSGLVLLRERVDLLGGSVQLVTAPGAGTAISARFPLGGLPRRSEERP